MVSRYKFDLAEAYFMNFSLHLRVHEHLYRPAGDIDVPALDILLKFLYRNWRPLQNHTKLIFHLTICSERPIGAIETRVGGPLPVPYDRPPATNYL